MDALLAWLRTAEEDDVFLCGAFAVSVVTGSAWFYQYDLCFALRLMH